MTDWPKVRVAVVIPALNEAPAIRQVLDAIPAWVSQVVVADNGSTDRTADIARAAGAQVVPEARRGYGAACLAGIAALRSPDIVVFLDGDFSDHPEQMERLVAPIVRGEAEFVVGSRTLGGAEPGALTAVQRFGNWFACRLVRLTFGVRYTDLGPFRAIAYPSLQRLAMSDRDYGWTIQMQVRAARLGLRTAEVPVTYRRRIGRSKISGTARGVVGAGVKIMATVLGEAVRARRRTDSPLRSTGASETVRLSIIIPTLDDAEALGVLLPRLRSVAPEAELIVADGGSRDHVAAVAREHGAALCISAAGRGLQLNRGADLAQGEVLWFVHADAGVPDDSLAALMAALHDPRVVGGAFSFQLAVRHAWAPLLDAMVNVRSRWLRLPYGDQGYFVRTAVFRALAGFRPLPIMEDVDFIRRLRRCGRVAQLSEALSVSARRWERDGVVRTTIRNQALLAAHLAGVPAARLVRWYPPRPASSMSRPMESCSGEVLLVFVRHSQPGAVKTRIAAAIGSQQAAELYSRMCRLVFEAVASWKRPGVRRVAVITPAETLDEVSTTLPKGFSAWPQPDGDLGDRLAATFATAFAEGARRVCVIGTDCIDISPLLLDRAFDALDEREAVIGPAADGGYWLLGLTRPVPHVFSEMPWSSNRVLPLTLERLADAGIEAIRLPVLGDLDTVDDLRAREWL